VRSRVLADGRLLATLWRGPAVGGAPDLFFVFAGFPGPNHLRMARLVHGNLPSNSTADPVSEQAPKRIIGGKLHHRSPLNHKTVIRYLVTKLCSVFRKLGMGWITFMREVGR